MRVVFIIFAVAGWVWTIGFLAYLYVHAMNRKREAMKKGFDVVPHEQV